MRLEGRIAVVTGGGSGIGASVCGLFAAEGATVVVLDRNQAGALATAAALPRASAMCVDVADPDQVDAAISQVVTGHGRIDVLANVAGIDDVAVKRQLAEHFRDGTPLDITARLSNEQWRRMMSVNLDGVFYTMRAALPVMLARGSGSIVNVSSVGGISGGAGMAHYSAAKAGVLGLTRSVAKEVADRGVRVNAIAPGTVDTPMLARSPAGIGGAVPMRRTASPAEIAAVALFLASDDSSYVTGETVSVNGGMLTV
jgi:3-oxoacyl-[acyl-carrier protein] reductase